MSQIPSTNSFLPPEPTTRTSTSRFNELSTEDFVKIMFTELTNQDPFQPNDSAALLQQLSSLRSIESDMSLASKLEAIVTQNELATAGNLIGQYVAGLTQDMNRVGGYVVSVLKAGDQVELELNNGWRVPIQNVDTIIDASMLPPRNPSSPVPTPPTAAPPTTTPPTTTPPPTDPPPTTPPPVGTPTEPDPVPPEEEEPEPETELPLTSSSTPMPEAKNEPDTDVVAPVRAA